MILNQNQEALIHAGVTVELSHTAFKIIRRLEVAQGRVVHWDSLITSVWDNPDDEPDNPKRCMIVTMSRVKTKLSNRGIPHPVRSRWGIGLFLDLTVFRDEPELVGAAE